MDCKYRRTERVGLYLMVFITMLNSCSIPSTLRMNRIDDDLAQIKAALGISAEE